MKQSFTSVDLTSIRIIAEAQYPSLDLRGIVPLSEKDIPAVPIVYVEDPTVTGRYCFSSHQEIQIGQRFYDLQRGLILVSIFSRDDFEVSDEIEVNILAHEWRHHWQYCNGYKSDSLGWPPPNVPDVYDQQIRAFFRRSCVEMDALIYAWKVTGKMDARVEEAIWGSTL